MSSIIKVDTIQTAAGGTPTAADLGINTTGTVLQIQSGVYEGANTTVTSTSYVTTPLTATITPSATSSKILIQASVPIDNNAGMRTDCTVYRNGTNIAAGANANDALITMNPISQSREIMQMNLLYMDTPASTSALTYTIYMKVQNQGALLFADASSATIALIEIA